MQLNHDEYVAEYYAVFHDAPPDDAGIYVYTYYDGNGNPLYHGLTTNARTRALEHYKKAPWASWVEDVRYRPCKNPQQARKLESRLHRKVRCSCWAGVARSYHGQDWSRIDREFKVNHVTGTCKLPSGICDPGASIVRRPDLFKD